MTPTGSPPPSETRLREEARALVVTAMSGEATAGDLKTLKRWRGRSAAHERAFARSYAIWVNLGAASAKYVEERRFAGRRPARPSARLGRRAFISGAIAASTAAAALVQPPFGLWPSYSALAADYRTAKGEQRSIETPGGSLVALNTSTSLNVDKLRTDIDRFELISGEIAVQTRAGSKPCSVFAADCVVSGKKDVSFTVRLEGGQIRVVCVTGDVTLTRDAAAIPIPPSSEAVSSTSAPAAVQPVDASAALASRTGFLIFQNEPLEKVIAEVNRYRPGKIVILNRDLAKRPVTARLRLDRLEEVLADVHAAFGATLRALPGGIVFVS